MRLPIRQLFRRLTRSERGFTLVELMASMVLFSLLLLAFTGWIASWGKDSAGTAITLQQELSAQTLFDTLRQDFHSAAVINGTGQELTFTTTKQEQIRYYVSNNRNLIRSVNGVGASVIAGNISRWDTKPVGTKGIEVSASLQKEGTVWSGHEVIALRGEGLPHAATEEAAALSRQ